MKFGNLVDTHCHLTSDVYKKNSIEIAEIINDAKNAGISKLITIACNVQESKENVDVANIYHNLFCTVGVHPTEVNDLKISDISPLKKLAILPKVVGIGECGLDYFHCKTPEEQGKQKVFFEEQIKLAIEVGKPLIIHCRDAFDDLIDILDRYYKKVKAVIHCFTGNKNDAKRLLNMGFYLSFSGILTFKNAGYLQDIVKGMDITKILIETDSPYLSPEPYRGEINFPKNIVFIATKIANLKKLTFEQIALQLHDNVQLLFKI